MITKGNQIGYKGDAFGNFGTSMTGEPLFINDLNEAGYYSTKQMKSELFIPHKIIRTFSFHLVFVRFGNLRQCSWTKMVHVNTMSKYMRSKQGTVPRYLEWSKSHRETVSWLQNERLKKRISEEKAKEEARKIRVRLMIEAEFGKMFNLKYSFYQTPQILNTFHNLQYSFNVSSTALFPWFFQIADTESFPAKGGPYSTNVHCDYAMFKLFETYQRHRARMYKELADRVEATFFGTHRFINDQQAAFLIRGLVFFVIFEKHLSLPPAVYQSDRMRWPVDRPLKFMQSYAGQSSLKTINQFIIPGDYKMMCRSAVFRLSGINKEQRDLVAQFLAPIYCMACFQWTECEQKHPSDPRRPACGCVIPPRDYLIPVVKQTISV